MAKAMLIMDMPKSCDVCDFVDERYQYCSVPWFGKDVSDYVECRHEHCPLRECPQKKEVKNLNEVLEIKKNGGDLAKATFESLTNYGYNACIDEILGGGE